MPTEYSQRAPDRDALWARIVELEAALRPFAKIARAQDEGHPNPLVGDDFVPYITPPLTMGDLRRAAKALS